MLCQKCGIAIARRARAQQECLKAIGVWMPVRRRRRMAAGEKKKEDAAFKEYVSLMLDKKKL